MNHRELSSPKLDGLIEKLQLRLSAHATAATREWWTKYLRGAASFRGVKMADVRKAVHAWFREERLGERLSVGQHKDLALMLLKEDYAEDKLGGVLFLQEILLPARALDWRSDLPRFACLFEQGYVRDWSTCDWFCVKVLGPLVEQQGEACARAIAGWREANSMWQQPQINVLWGCSVPAEEAECSPRQDEADPEPDYQGEPLGHGPPCSQCKDDDEKGTLGEAERQPAYAASRPTAPFRSAGSPFSPFGGRLS